MLRRLAGLLGAAAIVACGDSVVTATSTTTTAVACTLNMIVVAPSSVTLRVGDAARFTASGNAGGCGSPATAPTPIIFFWRSSDTSLATIDSASGLLTALKPGSVTAIAIAVRDPAVKGAAAVVINP